MFKKDKNNSELKSHQLSPLYWRRNNWKKTQIVPYNKGRKDKSQQRIPQPNNLTYYNQYKNGSFLDSYISNREENYYFYDRFSQNKKMTISAKESEEQAHLSIKLCEIGVKEKILEKLKAELLKSLKGKYNKNGLVNDSSKISQRIKQKSIQYQCIKKPKKDKLNISDHITIKSTNQYNNRQDINPLCVYALIPTPNPKEKVCNKTHINFKTPGNSPSKMKHSIADMSRNIHLPSLKAISQKSYKKITSEIKKSKHDKILLQMPDMTYYGTAFQKHENDILLSSKNKINVKIKIKSTPSDIKFLKTPSCCNLTKRIEFSKRQNMENKPVIIINFEGIIGDTQKKCWWNNELCYIVKQSI